MLCSSSPGIVFHMSKVHHQPLHACRSAGVCNLVLRKVAGASPRLLLGDVPSIDRASSRERTLPFRGPGVTRFYVIERKTTYFKCADCCCPHDASSWRVWLFAFQVLSTGFSTQQTLAPPRSTLPECFCNSRDLTQT